MPLVINVIILNKKSRILSIVFSKSHQKQRIIIKLILFATFKTSASVLLYIYIYKYIIFII